MLFLRVYNLLLTVLGVTLISIYGFLGLFFGGYAIIHILRGLLGDEVIMLVGLIVISLVLLLFAYIGTRKIKDHLQLPGFPVYGIGFQIWIYSSIVVFILIYLLPERLFYPG